jgi:hypothetical protein
VLVSELPTLEWFENSREDLQYRLCSHDRLFHGRHQPDVLQSVGLVLEEVEGHVGVVVVPVAARFSEFGMGFVPGHSLILPVPECRKAW